MSLRARLSLMLTLVVGPLTLLIPRTPVSAASGPQTILWSSGLTADLATAHLSNFAAYHLNGFNLDHLWGPSGPNTGYHDDLLNGGVGRLPSTQYQAYLQQVRTLVANAKTLGMTSIFERLLGQVYAPSHPAGLTYQFDPCDSSQVAQVQATMTAEAAFAQATGLRGIWIDAEPYNNADLWYADVQSGTKCYGLTYTQAALAYYTLGQTVARALLQADPTIQLIISPGIEVSYYRTGSYAHFADFYAGLLSVASRTPGALGIVNATESTYGWDTSRLSWFAPYASYIMGSGQWAGHTSNLQPLLQAYDSTFGTNTWNWHLQSDSVALATEPVIAGGSWAYAPSSYPTIENAQRSVSTTYTWIYDQDGEWLKATPAGTCLVGTWYYQGAFTCPGAMLSQILSPLSTSITSPSPSSVTWSLAIGSGAVTGGSLVAAQSNVDVGTYNVTIVVKDVTTNTVVCQATAGIVCLHAVPTNNPAHVYAATVRSLNGATIYATSSQTKA